jgi:hypothetical protein
VLVFMAQLDFCNDKTEVLAREHINLPGEITTGKLITPLLDDSAFPPSLGSVRSVTSYPPDAAPWPGYPGLTLIQSRDGPDR